jgi:hypothetical protein
MKYRPLKSAFRDLAEIEEWVTEHFGPSFAFDTENELFKTFQLSRTSLIWASSVQTSTNEPSASSITILIGSLTHPASPCSSAASITPPVTSAESAGCPIHDSAFCGMS